MSFKSRLAQLERNLDLPTPVALHVLHPHTRGKPEYAALRRRQARALRADRKAGKDIRILHVIAPGDRADGAPP